MKWIQDKQEIQRNYFANLSEAIKHYLQFQNIVKMWYRDKTILNVTMITSI